MLTLIFILPLSAALICLALSRLIPTRWLGIGASIAMLAAGGILLDRGRVELPLTVINHTWAMIGDLPIHLGLRFNAANWPFALLTLFGGGLAIFALSMSLSHDLRGFGGLLAALIVSLLATIGGLAIEDLVILPVFWMAGAIGAFITLRASGAFNAQETPLAPVIAGGISALALLGAALLTNETPAGEPLPPIALICWLLVAMLASGAPPFHATIRVTSTAPAALAGVILALGLPLLSGYALIYFVATQGMLLPFVWQLMLAMFGVLALLGSAAGALGSTRARELVSWQFSAQMGLVLIATALGGTAVAAPALLFNTAITTLVATLGVAVLERRAGSDDLSEPATHGTLIFPGVAMLVAAASAIGAPGTWGMWARIWLFDELMRTTPWAIPLLLAGSALLAISYIAPIAVFWRGHVRTAGGVAAAAGLTAPLLAALPLIILGVAPQLAWDGWMASAQITLFHGEPGIPPALPDTTVQIACGAAALALLALPLVGARRLTRHQPQEREQPVGIFMPVALGQSLRPLARLADPDGFQYIWNLLLQFSGLIRQALALFERRYYLAGLLLAMIIVILIFV